MNMEQQIVEISLADIIPNRFQPRQVFDEGALNELAASIKENGIIQPLVVRKAADNKFEIIAGERRFRAASLAGLTKVPAIISNVDDKKSAELAIIENLQRQNLSPMEEARSYKNILESSGITQDELAKKIGLSQSAIANKLRLLSLDLSVQDALLADKISERHARSLLAIKDTTLQSELLDRIITERLTVRQLDQEVKKILGDDSAFEDEIPIVELNPNIEDIKSNAVDIHPAVMTQKINEFGPTEIVDIIKPNPEQRNKFFNFLEAEEADLDTGTEAFTNVSEPVIPSFIEKANPPIDIIESVTSDENTEIIDEIPNDIDMSSIEDIPTSPLEDTFWPPKEEPLVFEPEIMSAATPATVIATSEKPDVNVAIARARNLARELERDNFVIQTEELDLPLSYDIKLSIIKEKTDI